PAAIDHLIEDRDAGGEGFPGRGLSARLQLVDGGQKRHPGRIRAGVHKWEGPPTEQNHTPREQSTNKRSFCPNARRQAGSLSYIGDYDFDLNASPAKSEPKAKN